MHEPFRVAHWWWLDERHGCRSRIIHQSAVARVQPLRHCHSGGGPHAWPRAADHRVYQPAETAEDTVHHCPQQGALADSVKTAAVVFSRVTELYVLVLQQV